ncbi:hypothetical protein ACET3X_002590 [Alternaria dauci]|uniref:Uncharacterized protein n=1 Tax=Alternaria dauci TaxID=48095 RepID=A0ABR3UR67_9PLEO
MQSTSSAVTSPELPLQPRLGLEAVSNPGQSQTMVPMGFAAQLRAVQEAQQEQAERIAKLEQENADLKASEQMVIDVADRIRAFEQHEAYVAARRREAVSQLLNMRTLYQEADNAFQLRTLDMQPDDLEGMLGVYGTLLTTTMNHHQRVLGHMCANGYLPTYATPIAQTHQAIVPMQYRHAYPPGYSDIGYCYAHNMPYHCRVCSNMRTDVDAPPIHRSPASRSHSS